MQSTDITSLLEFYRLAAPTLDAHFTLKESAFRCNKALQKSKVERPWQNEIKVEILKLIIMLCNSHPLKELRFLEIHTTNHKSQSNSSSFPFLEEFCSYYVLHQVEGRLSLVLKKEVEELSKFVNRGICRDMPCFQVTSTTIFITKKRDFVCYVLVRQNFDVRKELECKKIYCKFKSIPEYQDFPVRCLIA